jgi:hypothetical protein
MLAGSKSVTRAKERLGELRDPMTATFMAAVIGKKNAAKRPETKEGGREEEKSRLGIASVTRGSG